MVCPSFKLWQAAPENILITTALPVESQIRILQDVPLLCGMSPSYSLILRWYYAKSKPFLARIWQGQEQSCLMGLKKMPS